MTSKLIYEVQKGFLASLLSMHRLMDFWHKNSNNHNSLLSTQIFFETAKQRFLKAKKAAPKTIVKHMAKTNPMKLPSIKLSMQFPFLRLAAFFRLAVSVVSTSSPNISFIVFNLCLRVETVSSSAPEEVIGTEKFVINQHNPAGANSPSLREQIPLNIPLKMYLKLTKCCLDD